MLLTEVLFLRFVYVFVFNCLGLLGLVAGGDLLSLFSNYLFVDFETNSCHRRCYQDYQYKSNDFYTTCYDEINDASVAANYTLASQLQNFNFFRNQACDTNEDNLNCYETASQLLLPTIDPTELPAYSSAALSLKQKDSSAAPPPMMDTITKNLVDTLSQPGSSLAMATFFAEEAKAEGEAAEKEGETGGSRKLSAEEEATRDMEVIDTGIVSRRLQAALDLLDPTCNYFNISSTWNPLSQSVMDFNNLVLSGVCGQFVTYGCCAANIVSLVAQDQTSATDIKIFPPCLLRYINVACPLASLTDFCHNGSVANLTTMVGAISMDKIPPNSLLQPFPNMYDLTSILTLQGLISFGFSGVPGLNAIEQPYALNPLKPLQVQITDFVYYNASGYQLTPTNGSAYYPPEGDYEAAASGTFYFQLVNQNLNDTEQENNLYNAILNPYFTGTLGSVYGTTVTSEQVTAPLMFEAQPLDLPAKSAASTVLATSRSGMTMLAAVLSVAAAATVHSAGL